MSHRYTAAAEQGDNKALHNLGICYERGKGTEANLTAALDW